MTIRTTKIIIARVGSVGLRIRAMVTGGISANIGPIKGIMAKIPATKAIEAAKSILKILRIIQVRTPAIIPKIT